jgi:phosphate transport system substrate-binding protein
LSNRGIARALLLAAAPLTLPHAMLIAQDEQLPSFTPSPLKASVVRSWGNDAMRPTLVAWEQAFRKYHPEITFDDKLYGSDTGMAGIITGVSDLALMGRPVAANEVIGFEWVHRTKPLGIQVLTGGLGGDRKTASLGVYVSQSNPLHSISMAQLKTILACPEDDTAAVTWSLAGPAGAWASRPIHAYLFDNQTGTGAFLQSTVEGTRDCWNWSIVREFSDKPQGQTASQQIVAALQRDPDGLAIANLGSKVSGIKLVAISGDGAPVGPDAASLVNASYPLTRAVFIYIRRDKDKPVDPRVKEFLTFVLSREGQSVAAKVHDYLPISAERAKQQQQKLE